MYQLTRTEGATVARNNQFILRWRRRVAPFGLVALIATPLVWGQTEEPLSDFDGDGFLNYVEAAARSDPYNWASRPAATTILLSVGYNQIQIPADFVQEFGLPSPSAFGVLSLLGNDTKIESIQTISPDDGRVREARYVNGQPSGDDFPIRPGQGLIVFAKVPKQLSFSSTLCPNLGLRTGSNLVGVPCFSEGSSAYRELERLGGPNFVGGIQRFNSVTGRFETANYHANQPAGVDFPIVPGDGYAVLMKQDRPALPGLGAPPTLSNVNASPALLAVPGPGEQFILRLTFDYSDTEGDITALRETQTDPAGGVVTRSVQFLPGSQAGNGMRNIGVDASFAPGSYRVELELRDSMGNRSAVHSASFEVRSDVAPPLEIESFSPGDGRPGDKVIIIGAGFDVESLFANEVRFGSSARAEFLSASATQIEVLVPQDALTGPIIVENRAGRTQASSPFTVIPTITVLPSIDSLQVGQSVDFDYAHTGLTEQGIVWSLNGDSTPDPSLGTIDADGIYTAPPALPPVNPVQIRATAVDTPGVFGEVSVQIVPPPPVPAQGLIVASRGGRVISEEGDVSLEIAPGALPADTVVTVDQIELDDSSIFSTDIVNLGAVRLEPSGLVFPGAPGVFLSFSLRHWVPPNRPVSVFMLDEATGSLVFTGPASVDSTRMKATVGPISHFSIYVIGAVRPIRNETYTAFLARKSGTFEGFLITAAPGMSDREGLPQGLLEGLTVPVLVKPDRPIDIETDGPGPFHDGARVAAILEGTARETTPLIAGPLVQASADGWKLGTDIHIPTLWTCGQGQSLSAHLVVDYPSDTSGTSAEESVTVSFPIACLDELAFNGDTVEGVLNSDRQNLRVVASEGKKIVQVFPGQSSLFSRLDIGVGGVLRVFPTNGTEETSIEVTGDVTIAGEIRTRAAGEIDTQSGALFPCSQSAATSGSGSSDGGEGGMGCAANGGSGGEGGAHIVKVDPNDPFCIGFGFCESEASGEDGGPSLYTRGSSRGGRGGEFWEADCWLDDFLDAALLVSAVYGMGTSTQALEFFNHFYSASKQAGAVLEIAESRNSQVDSLGHGGYNNRANAPRDISRFYPPQAGNGGGGGGKTIVPLACDLSSLGADHAGGGAGGGGGAAPNLKLVSGGNVVIASEGLIDGRGGMGGPGANGDGSGDTQGGPGGGGGGGSGAAIHVAGTGEVTNQGEIQAPGGPGGLAGPLVSTVCVEQGPFGCTRTAPHLVFPRQGMGSAGEEGVFRFDGPMPLSGGTEPSFEGSAPVGMDFFKGPAAGNTRVTATILNEQVYLGDLECPPLPIGCRVFYRAEQSGEPAAELLSADSKPRIPFELLEGLNTLSFQTVSLAAPPNLVSLHPWQKQQVFFFPELDDSDGDGLKNGLEEALHTSPTDRDSDDDGLDDPVEVLQYGTDPTKIDTDGDGLTDPEEIANCKIIQFPLLPAIITCLDPLNPDTDGDGASDGFEIASGTDPYILGGGPNEAPEICDGVDNDGDGLTDERVCSATTILDTWSSASARGGRRPSITIAANGLPLISYLVDDGARPLSVASCGNVACSSEFTACDRSPGADPPAPGKTARCFVQKDTTPPSTIVSNTTSSIAIGADLLPIIGYDTNRGLEAARCRDWRCYLPLIIETPDPNIAPDISVVDANALGRPSIAIGRDGLPIMSYVGTSAAGAGILKVAHCGDRKCSADNILSVIDDFGSTQFSIGLANSLAIGADGLPVISYAGRKQELVSTLKVAHCQFPNCGDASLVDVPGSPGGLFAAADSYLAIGPEGLPVMSIIVAGPTIGVLRCGDPACSAGNMFAGIEAGSFSSSAMAIGVDGLPVMVYLRISDAPPGNLKVAHCGNASCTSGNTIAVIDRPSGGQSVTNLDLAIGADGLPIITYYYSDTELRVHHCGSLDCASLDMDGDGLANDRETNAGTDPFTPDTDRDGLMDGEEVFTYRTDPLDPDSDADRLLDGDEVRQYGTDPLDRETDGDLLPDGDEVQYYCVQLGSGPLCPDPTKPDTDGDGFTDTHEVACGTSPTSATSRPSDFFCPFDPDADGLSDSLEILVHMTDPRDPDSDDDRLSDGDEITRGMDPHNPDTDGDGCLDGHERLSGCQAADADFDGLSDSDERLRYGTDPDNQDTDGDLVGGRFFGVRDGEEISAGTNPLDPDTDDDGYTDGVEVFCGSNPRSATSVPGSLCNPDADGDLLKDNIEVFTHRTDPLKQDTDGDALDDGVEVNTSLTDPLKRDTDSDRYTDAHERYCNSNPLSALSTPPASCQLDSDNDGLGDSDEVYVHGTDPVEEDTDGDGLADGVEITVHQTDPLIYDTDGDGDSDGEEVGFGCGSNPLRANSRC